MTKFVGNERETSDLTQVGIIKEIRATTEHGSVWDLCLETPAREGFEDFESPQKHWFTMDKDLEQQAMETFSIGERVKVSYQPALNVVRIDNV